MHQHSQCCCSGGALGALLEVLEEAVVPYVEAPQWWVYISLQCRMLNRPGSSFVMLASLGTLSVTFVALMGVSGWYLLPL